MRMIIDCDPGNSIPASDIDDGLALGLALAAPGVTLEAVTVVAGNTPRDVGVAVARDLLARAGAHDVPIFPGAAAPLVEDPAPWRADLDGRRDTEAARALWRDVVPSSPVDGTGEPSAAVEIVRRVAASPGEIHLVAVGPLTNVAHALQLRPQLAAELASLTIMGGGFAVPDLLQELNFGYDPEAAHLVLTSGAPITLVPYDVTRLTTLTLGDIEPLAGVGPLADYLAETTRPWIRWVSEARGLPGCHLHDPLAVAALLDPGLVTKRRTRAAVELHGTLTRGRPIAWTRPLRATGLRIPDVEPIDVVDSVDNDRLVAFLVDTLVSAGR
ncbi:nucleoside hydrolase [Nonomuraea sp. NPDC046802]|uniref:nucleoside hydrolase n=1 Tax=Nonomuraea sp. NPDC046802 TaxID=3154919 RepID=UPI0033DC14C5